MTHTEKSVLSPQEVVARDIILERTRAHSKSSRIRRHARTALLLRRMATHLDPPALEPETRPGVRLRSDA